ncbi:hypothetical protein DFH06DRAFT_1125519 [Mycena polygramma]|nr:hypothetical protein DFH06DRAFT_1125519 [Mycena polygramma]
MPGSSAADAADVPDITRLCPRKDNLGMSIKNHDLDSQKPTTGNEHTVCAVGDTDSAANAPLSSWLERSWQGHHRKIFHKNNCFRRVVYRDPRGVISRDHGTSAHTADMADAPILHTMSHGCLHQSVPGSLRRIHKMADASATILQMPTCA